MRARQRLTACQTCASETSVAAPKCSAAPAAAKAGDIGIERCYRSTAFLGLPPSLPLALEAAFFDLLLDRPPI